MTDRRVVLGSSFTAAALVIVHSLLWDFVRRREGAFIANNADLVTIGAAKAGWFRLSLVADALGSYLLTLPATLTLWRLLRRERGPSAALDTAALGGAIYAAAGATAAAALAIAGEELIRGYATAAGSEAHAIATAFSVAMNAAVGVWQIAAIAAGGTWWLVSGWMLRSRWYWFARYSMALGAVSLSLSLSRTAGVSFDFTGPATAAFFPIAVWIGWLGLRLVRDESVA